ncbi:hypothetical protein GGTG_12310 [Gaeumannomyces tritici R3-111a-1]|uniref:Uncharacterized protein n=1 Tax=Gaeumannomyces tritici (strain R3-111a-1) TaxID=644352 RepID=J3PFN5_GAET3|nr:hypothetical protein GGTG_12310 [Gaeumannomyces tritici R3-111a-1]EJT70137.1 hypothetical protein GGTG_12310 [Gaeumannomyces tritici R3-111a-1]
MVGSTSGSLAAEKAQSLEGAWEDETKPESYRLATRHAGRVIHPSPPSPFTSFDWLPPNGSNARLSVPPGQPPTPMPCPSLSPPIRANTRPSSSRFRHQSGLGGTSQSGSTRAVHLLPGETLLPAAAPIHH